MSIPIVIGCCYTCGSCQVIKKICRRKNIVILNIYKDKCPEYTASNKLIKCELCGSYILNLRNHLAQIHEKTIEEYKIITQLGTTKSVNLKGKNLF